jgi:DNA helicase HerA-like ATPase
VSDQHGSGVPDLAAAAPPGSLGARVGAVDGSTEAGTRRFFVVLDDDAHLALDELVVCRQRLPGSGLEVAHYGIVVEQTGTIEGTSWPSDTRHVLEGTMPGAAVRRAEVLVLRTDPEVWVAPAPGAEVHRTTGTQRARALFEDQMRSKLPVGLDQAGEPVHADFSFIDGEQGGHVSISGISGVAAKTSYALFLLYMIFETEVGRSLLGAHAANTRALLFNVKGEDLLHLDRPNRHFDDEARARWRALGVGDPRPFGQVSFHVPPQPGGSTDELAPDARSRAAEQLSVYGWTPESFVRQGLLRFCFTEGDERSTQVGFVEQVVRTQLARHAHPLAGEEGAVVICPQAHTSTHTFERVVARRPPAQPAGAGTPIRGWHDLVDLLVVKLDPAAPDPAWTGATQPGTLMAFLRRLMALGPRLGHLVRCGVREVSLSSALTVVDIHSLHESAQRFVVGALVSRVFEEKQSAGREPLRFVMLDELNKYAPREGHGPLRELFVDIAERGRSLGVLLIGCQQAAGRVAEPVVRQPALKVAGRLDAGEAAEHRHLTPELRERATRFLPGTMVLDQPLVPVPLSLRFPRAPYATNLADAAATEEDRAAAEAAFDWAAGERWSGGG